ncbi:MAG: ABC transporter permease [Candidatus Rokuibacteriota bacterium]|nr:MAG: ABC transporter permease [Candidatus Rokubacteria bacterium]PYN61574.1 MAG: ABC transporter permease [Candidatus Rokubacteria bacterium]
MIAPAVLYIVLVVGLPFVLAILYAFSGVTMGSRTIEFVGFKNFISVLETTKFQTSLRNTFVFALIAQVLVMVLGTVLAMALLKDFRGKWLVRLLILLPWVAPISLGTIGWLWILDSTYSVINWTLEALGLIGADGWFMWLGVPYLAMGSVITIHVWRILPLATVILLAGLTSIPHDIHDAAQVDGASFWRHLFQITLPLIRPIMLVAGLFGLVFAFTDMIVIFVLTRGGPYDTTQVLASLAFFTGIQAGDLAEGAAIALFLFPLLLAVAVAFLRVARRAEVT